MLTLTKKTDYGLLALHYLAQHNGGQRSKVREIARKYQVPEELLAKVLQKLAKSGLVESAPGPAGGYRLKQKPKRITLARVITAVEGPEHDLSCLRSESRGCNRIDCCMTRRPTLKAQEKVAQVLERMTLVDIS